MLIADEALEWARIKHVHIIGVGGTLMGAFAAYLVRRGVKVSGSDVRAPYPPMDEVLEAAGIQVQVGFQPSNLDQQGTPDLVVIGNVVSQTNPESQAALERFLRYTSLPQFLETYLLPQSKNLVVAGTHGKTTTSSLLAHTLQVGGLDPSFVIGGVAPDLRVGFHISERTTPGYFVLEGDEYDTAYWDRVPKFNHYLPNEVILTSVEYDHADIYPDFEAIKKVFGGLVSRIRSGGHLIGYAGDPEVIKLLGVASCEVAAYGDHALSHYPELRPFSSYVYADRIQTDGTGTHFNVLDQHDQLITPLQMQLTGQHNIRNALACFLQAKRVGLTHATIAKAFASFRGVKRRQELRGVIGGVSVIDDFAHHPSAVRETLSALRLRYPSSRLLVVFEPRSATSRRKVFQKDYESAFKESSITWIAEPPNLGLKKLEPEEKFSSSTLVSALRAQDQSAFLLNLQAERFDIRPIVQKCRSGDVVAVLSNGSFSGVIPDLLEALSLAQRHSVC